MKGDSAVRDIQSLPDNGHLYAPHVINDIWRLTDGNAIIVTDVGQHQMWEAQYYHHDKPRTLITSGGLGTMGFALPAAIGAKIASPDTEVWAVVGDGGFQMTMCELATMVQEQIEINVAIINNGYLGMVRQWQEFFYERRYAATPLSTRTSSSWRRRSACRRHGRRSAADVMPAVEAARDEPQDGGDRLPGGAGRHGVPDGAGRRDLDAMIRRPSPPPIVETGADRAAEPQRASKTQTESFKSDHFVDPVVLVKGQQHDYDFCRLRGGQARAC